VRGVRAGRLKDYLAIQTSVDAGGEHGGNESTWTTKTSRECDIKPQRAVEFYRAGGENVQAVYEIRFRYEEGLLSESMRLLDTAVSPNRVFDIQAIINQGNFDGELVVTAMERKWPVRD
jgi:head-tail adaptor